MTELRPYRVLVTGSRTWQDEQAIRDALAVVIAEHGPENVTVVHGAAQGADVIADHIAHAWTGVTVERHPADWAAPCGPSCPAGHRRQRGVTTYCPAAGVNRNQTMVDLGADVVLAFQIDGSRGTADCIRRAEKAGIPVRRYERSSRANA